ATEPIPQMPPAPTRPLPVAVQLDLLKELYEAGLISYSDYLWKGTLIIEGGNPALRPDNYTMMLLAGLGVGRVFKVPSLVPNTSGTGSGSQTVDDILVGKVLGRATKGKTTQYIGNGGVRQANAEFDALGPTNVKPISTKYGPGRTGTLPDGRTATVRPGS